MFVLKEIPHIVQRVGGNEDTRMQLELINESLAELQTKNKALNKPRNPIGFTASQDTQ